MRHLTTLVITLLLLTSKGFSQNVETSVFSSHSGQRQWITYRDNHRSLYRIISNEAFEQLDKRARHVSGLSSPDDWRCYQQALGEEYGSTLKKFSRTPLNPRITGRIEKDHYTVEKVLFESHPGFYVTGCLFIPKKRQEPAPTVIYCSGHSAEGFRSTTYQKVILNLTEKGFIVFAFDPLGQGERLQYPDLETGKSTVGGATTEHSYAGIQTLLAGTSLSDYFIWDGVRAIDYLETREEVDMSRVGITGRSGGGTQSAMIAAFDERILAAAPECYITTFKRLLQSIGPQDAEQNPYRAIKRGWDIPDFIHLRAPKPTLVITTTHDFFSQQGAREAFDEARKSYSALGKVDNIQFAEDFGGHESTKNNRETMYAFFQEHLDLPGDKTDREVVPFKEDELWVTSTGQIGSSLKGKTVFDLNKEYFTKARISRDELINKAKELSGIKFDRELTSAVYTGKFSRENYTVDKYFIENSKKDYALPLFVIKKKAGETVKEEKNQCWDNVIMWIHPEGKEKILNEPLLTKLLDAGNVIVSADMPGTGELVDPQFSGDAFVKGVPFNYVLGANLTGMSIPGIQAEAIDLVSQFIRMKENTDSDNWRNKTENDLKMNVLVQENSVSPFLHWAICKDKDINYNKVILLNFPEDASYFLETKQYDPTMAFSMVPGSIPYYGLNDLAKIVDGVSGKMLKIQKDENMVDGKSDEIDSSIMDFISN